MSDRERLLEKLRALEREEERLRALLGQIELEENEVEDALALEPEHDDGA